MTARLLGLMWAAVAAVALVFAVFVVRAHILVGDWCAAWDRPELEQQHGAFTGTLVRDHSVAYWPPEMRCRLSDASGRTVEVRRSAFT